MLRYLDQLLVQHRSASKRVNQHDSGGDERAVGVFDARQQCAGLGRQPIVHVPIGHRLH